MKRDEAAWRIWPVLTALAERRGTITYSALADVIGSVDHRHGWPLGLIQDYCLNLNLPPLTILVVSKTSGRPGHGFTDLEEDELQTGRHAVWAYPWSPANPFDYAASGAEISELARRACRDPNAAAEIYALVRSRGVAQMIFRRAVLLAYASRCAFCGVSFTACLEAAHIIPWTEASHAERISPTNGLCLCANHHRMFDGGHMTLSPEGKVVCETTQADETWSDGDRALTTRLERKDAHMPRARTLWPALASLAWSYQDHGWNALPWSLRAPPIR